MSGQDVNPFADPADVNPFAEPSAVQDPKSDFSNDFNPFAAQQSDPVVSTFPSPTSPPVYSQPQSPKPKSPTQIQPVSPATIEPIRQEQQQTIKQTQPAFKSYGTNEDPIMRERQEELERKAADLERREAELKIRASEGQNNFPPLPKCCCVGPCYYHDISMDIPIEHQRTCRMVFYTWQLYVLTLLFNTISALAGLCVGASDGAMLFGVSILYLVLFPMLSFVLWYRPVYKALRKNSSFNFMMFFFIFACQTVFMFLYALGINRMGTCGWINGASLADSDGNHAVSAMYFVTGALFTLLTIISVYLIRRIHIIFRTSGASLQKAQQEFAKDMASNKAVQKAAADAVVAGTS